ncbi:phospholipase D-like domain-containing protein [Paenibacillus sp. MMS18-CY102]|uniref:phospholipase D-like domain-containing protein n=1 Tax=Paenibacillus sp. MMS18-CY102 TaxID=2682849 RepID=UPI0013660F1D|nr:phospholipase D-like domain-containing protein [Paenibacillus sp. MMS18-CY102]MWC30796.1 hypothetical protein [Paenibacillus sp. MMS18-CY102]
MAYRAYFDIPIDTVMKPRGSSPYLLDRLIEELQNAANIKLSLFLYNNLYLHEKLEQLSAQGCSVHIYSIPLNGYSKQTVNIYNPETSARGASSKFDYAKGIYKRIEDGNFPKISLRLFPHTYQWYKQHYSRGKEAYSLHNKSILIELRDGSTKCISLSSNLAYADPPHSDNLLVIENEPNTAAMFKTYFGLLEKHSLSLAEYKDFSGTKCDSEYLVEPTALEADEYQGCYYSAPFIAYGGRGSNHFVQDQIIAFIQSAKRRVYLCAQHFMDIDPFDKAAKSIVTALGELAGRDPSVEIKALKQTRADNQAQGKRTHLTEAYLKRWSNVEQRFWSPIIHDKFIIVDDKIIVMTANITPTQFAWRYPHKMQYAANIQDNRMQNCFSEINSFHFIEDAELTGQYEAHFQTLWGKANTV